jgi:hypothetical protein
MTPSDILLPGISRVIGVARDAPDLLRTKLLELALEPVDPSTETVDLSADVLELSAVVLEPL